MDSYKEVTHFVRDIRGPAASILWVLMLTGRSLTGHDLEEATGYSDKSVKSGLDRLATYGLIQDNGQLNGHSINRQLPLPFLELWQGHHGKFIEDGIDDANITDSAQTGRLQAAAYSPDGHKFPLVDAGSQDTLPSAADDSTVTSPPSSEKIGNSDLCGEKIGNSDLPSRDLGCLVDCSLNSEEEETTNQTTKTAATSAGNSDLPRLLRRLRISGPVYTDICRRKENPAQVLAWHWWVCCQPWLNRNPVGYVVARLKERKPAPGDWLALVEWWQGLDADGRHAVLAHVTGSDNGRLLHLAATGGADLAYWLDDDFDELPETAVLDALIDLARYAPQELALQELRR